MSRKALLCLQRQEGNEINSVFFPCINDCVIWNTQECMLRVMQQTGRLWHWSNFFIFFSAINRTENIKVIWAILVSCCGTCHVRKQKSQWSSNNLGDEESLWTCQVCQTLWHYVKKMHHSPPPKKMKVINHNLTQNLGWLSIFFKFSHHTVNIAPVKVCWR